MKKYDMRICKCGRIHMIPEENLTRALENDKNLVLMCAGCGSATIIGADIEPDMFSENPNDLCYMMYAGDLSPYENKIITEEIFKGSEREKAVSEIFYSHGLKVPMKTGNYANNYFDGRFADMWYPDFYKIQRKDVTVPEIMDFIKEFTEERTTVSMNRFINENPEDMIEEISHYWIKGFDWTGTKYENEFNKK